LRGGRIGQPGQAEIQDLHHAAARHEDVLGLEIAVHNSERVGRAQAAGDLLGVRDGQDRRERLFETLPQSFAAQQFRDQVRRSVFAPEIVDCKNVRVVQ
jgi:hypothetical protein